jgi:hypothetical protein
VTASSPTTRHCSCSLTASTPTWTRWARTGAAIPSRPKPSPKSRS